MSGPLPAAERLEREPNVWLATVRPDGRPHLVPIWFVVDDGRWYICTAPGSVKARNLQANPRVSLALEDGTHPLVVEGEARPVDPSPAVAGKFKVKYDWDIRTDDTYTQVYQIVVTRHLLGGGA